MMRTYVQRVVESNKNPTSGRSLARDTTLLNDEIQQIQRGRNPTIQRVKLERWRGADWDEQLSYS
jgi:hypothetical protein